jgi:predicted RNA-binding protein with RPS1 domain
MENKPVQHQPGDRVTVIITSIVPFGAFADLTDGGSGLIHISEIDEKFIKNIADYLPVGSIHEVLVTGLGKKPFTYALSLKRISKRKRQTQVNSVKPKNRRAHNREVIDSYAFSSLKEKLPQMIADEKQRFDNKQEG